MMQHASDFEHVPPPQHCWKAGLAQLGEPGPWEQQIVPLAQQTPPVWPVQQKQPSPVMQLPPQQMRAPPTQARLQAPQLLASEVRSVQVPPQLVWPLGQAGTHRPPEQT